MGRPVAVTAAVVALCLSSAALAVTLIGVSANTLPEGKFMFDTWFMWRDYTREYEQGLQGGDTVGWVDLPASETRTHGTIAPRLLYGVTDWLTIRKYPPPASFLNLTRA